MGLLLDVAVVGGGPGGLAAAKSILTARPELRVGVFERSANITAPRGASLTLLPNGFRALQAIDPLLRERVLSLDANHLLKRTCTSAGVQLIELTGEAVHGGMAKHGDVSHVAWHDLRLALADSLPAGVVHTGLGFERYEAGEDGGVRVHFRGPQGETQVVEAKVLVGADGNQSGVRQQLLGDGAPAFIGTAIWRAVLPSCPPCWQPPESAALWWLDIARSQGFCAFSLPGGRLSLLGTAPWREEDLGQLADANYVQEPEQRAKQGQQAKQRLMSAFGEGWPAEVRELIAAVDPTQLTEHGQYYREPESCGEWGRGAVTLLGDAAHLSTPFLAQGTSQAFEDAVELGRAIHELGPTPEALRHYEAVRRPQNRPIHEASVSLFREFVAGRGRPTAEHETNIAQGFVARAFEPLPRPVEAAAVA